MHSTKTDSSIEEFKTKIVNNRIQILKPNNESQISLKDIKKSEKSVGNMKKVKISEDNQNFAKSLASFNSENKNSPISQEQNREFNGYLNNKI